MYYKIEISGSSTNTGVETASQRFLLVPYSLYALLRSVSISIASVTLVQSSATRQL